MKAAVQILALALAISACSGTQRLEAAGESRNEVLITEGSGSFLMQGGRGHEATQLRVHFHKPRNFSGQSPILIVLPGAGRNGDSYRDSWVSASEQHGVLVLSPTYPEQDYDMAAYQFGGVIRNLKLRNLQVDANAEIHRIRDEDIAFDISNPDDWLFHDFDRLFALTKRAVNSKQTRYDLFGHSAGGQILHRLAIFHPASRARMVLAANAGLYTVPDPDIPLPFGVKDTAVSSKTLKRSFSTNLVVFLGELDDENETRGIQTRTPTADRMGIGRLAKGKYFYGESRRIAARLGTGFNWKLEVVPGVGHDQEKMAAAAAKYLYGNER